MAQKLDPFKLELLIPTKGDLQGIKPVKVMDIMEGFTKNFHPDGLFSSEIFGKIGEERRSKTFSYINLNVPVFHPLIYKAIVDLKELYSEIMLGRSYAIFDPVTKDFIKSNVAEGETGYAFFVKHFKDLQFEQRPSISRKLYIDFVNKYRDNAFVEQFIILPAGMRDYTVDEDGKPSEDEINGMYRSLMAIASAMENLNIKANPEFVDTSRASLQVKTLELYRYIVSLLIGKHKLIQGSFLSRKLGNSTRNVISAGIPNIKKFGDDATVTPNTVVMGLYQYMRDVIPLLVFNIRTKIANQIFSGATTNMNVTDPKTLKMKSVPIISREFNRWMTFEGIEKTADQFSQLDLRHYPVMIGNDYFGLIYKGPDNTFKFIQDIDEVPSGRSKKDVTPITMAELLYLASYETAKESYGFATRYPVTTYGSTFPCITKLRTTVTAHSRTRLDDAWNPTDDKATSWPVMGEKFFDSMTIPDPHLGRAGADYDGDQMSHYTVMTEEAIEEIRNILGSPNYYLNLDKTMAFSLATPPINLAMSYLTGR